MDRVRRLIASEDADEALFLALLRQVPSEMRLPVLLLMHDIVTDGDNGIDAERGARIRYAC